MKSFRDDSLPPPAHPKEFENARFGPFRVRFGGTLASLGVLGGVGVGSGRGGSVREKNITKLPIRIGTVSFKEKYTSGANFQMSKRCVMGTNWSLQRNISPVGIGATAYSSETLFMKHIDWRGKP